MTVPEEVAWLEQYGLWIRRVSEALEKYGLPPLLGEERGRAQAPVWQVEAVIEEEKIGWLPSPTPSLKRSETERAAS